MDEIKFANNIIDKAKEMDLDDIEVFYNSSKNLDVVWEKGDLQIPKTDLYQGFGIRVFKDGKTGFSSSNILDEKEGERVLNRAAEIADITPSDDSNYLPEKSEITYVEDIVDEKNDDIKLVHAVEKGKEFVENFLNYDKRVKLDTANFNTRLSKRVIVNSNGIKASEEKTVFENMAMAFAREEENVSSFDLSFQIACKLSELNLKEEAEELAKKVVNSLDAESVESFEGSVILTPFSVLSVVASALSFAVNGENVINGISPWADKMGDKVAIPELSVIDDAHIAGGVGSRSFDREGVASKKLDIIKNGKLNSFIHNIYTAHKMDTESTGHASGGAQSKPGVSPSNFIIEGGDKSLDEIIKDTEKGILVNRFSGNTDPVSGDFSGVVKGGKYIENGEVVKSIKGVMIAGNVYDLLNNISAMTEKKQFIQNFRLPHIRFEDVSITGQ